MLFTARAFRVGWSVGAAVGLGRGGVRDASRRTGTVRRMSEDSSGTAGEQRLTMRVREADGSWGESEITELARMLLAIGRENPREQGEGGVEFVQLVLSGAWEWEHDTDETALAHIANGVYHAIEQAVRADERLVGRGS